MRFKVKKNRAGCPRLYDLTTLQRKQTDYIVYQLAEPWELLKLSEKHKVIAYPRTDSKALPEDYVSTCNDLLQRVSELPIICSKCFTTRMDKSQ